MINQFSMVTMLYSLSVQNQSLDKRFDETKKMAQFVLYYKEREGVWQLTAQFCGGGEGHRPEAGLMAPRRRAKPGLLKEDKKVLA